MTHLTKEEMEAIYREAELLYPYEDDVKVYATHNTRMHSARAAHIIAKKISEAQLKEERERAAKLLEALEGIIQSWDNRMSGDVEKKIKSTITDTEYWSPIASQVDSEKIAAGREALNNYK